MKKTKQILLVTMTTLLFTGLVACSKPAPKEVEEEKVEEVVTDVKDEKEVETEEVSAEEKYVNEVYKLVAENWGHMDRVWPGLNYSEHDLIILHYVDDKVDKAWVMNTETMDELPQDEIDKIKPLIPGGYLNTEHNGRKSIIISINDQIMNMDWGVGKQFTYDLATHEMIHFYYQADLDSQTDMNTGSRSAAYPVDPSPRVDRAMVLERLIEAYKNPDERDDYLAQAKYWNEEWKSKFPDESSSIKYTDISEGAPRYIELRGKVANPDIPEAEVNEFITSSIDGFMKNIADQGLDGEAYLLGAVSGLILDDVKPDWKNDYYKLDITPTELLLQDYEAKENPAVDSVKENIEKEIGDKNVEDEARFKQVDEALENVEIPILVLEDKHSSGATMSMGSYLYKGMDVTPHFTGNYVVNDKTISLKDATVFYDPTKEPVSMFAIFGDYTFEDSILKINNEHIQMEAPATKTEDANGKITFTLNE